MADQLNDEELKRAFLKSGSKFFSFNGSSNTPNILIMLKDNVSHLDNTLKRASESSDRLSNSLNKLTKAALLVSSIALVIAGGNLILDFLEYIKQ